MIKAVIIGNLTRAPEVRDVEGKTCCTFTVAVNLRRGANAQAEYIRVTAWAQLGDLCASYLDKGRKVSVATSRLSAHGWQGRDGGVKAQIECVADDVEFLTPKGAQTEGAQTEDAPAGGDFTEVEDDELPFA